MSNEENIDFRIKLVCLLCGRDKFKRKSPHHCAGGFRKHGIVWAIKTHNALFKFMKRKKTVP